MFTNIFFQQTEYHFQEQMKRLGKKCGEVERVLAGCSVSEAEALKCLYASMPVSDALDYPPELYLAYARHGVFLWEQGPFAGRIPEDVFAGYVLHHRVNNEDLTECRRFFYEELREEIRGLGMEEAIKKINYWCASRVTYRASDERTAGAATLLCSAYGRCGEESTFAVTALRSLGIPARQVYVPLWSHCDDNHAWVEVWCDGTWKFLGACEPEEVLNKGWFTNASSRAMMVHSRWLLPAGRQEKAVGKKGMAVVLNQLNRYACTVCLKVTVLEEDGMPSADTQVHFEVMNYACFGEIADVRTGDDGACTLETGLGTLLVTACKNGSCGEALVHTQEQTECTLRLGGAQEKENIWEKMMIFAPKDAPVNRFSQSPEEIAEGRRKCEAASAIRRERENSFYDEDMAEKAAAGFSAADQERCRRIMKLAGGNQKEIAGFLARPANGMYRERRKLDLLESLREKDYLDITADLLEENARYASAFEGSYPEEIFISCILCPRVENEMIRSYRTFISRWLNDEEKEYMKKQPSLVWKKVKETLRSDETLEYGNLITSAEGALTGGWGSVLTQKVVTVQILRTLGIAARLNPADGRPEIWRDGCFVTLEKESGRTAGIILQKQPEIPWTYFQNWTIARFENGAYRTLQMCVENTEGEVMLLPGRYRMLTANRLPNGNIFAEKMVFELLPGEKRTITPKLYEAQPRDLLEENDIADFSLKTPDGKEHRVSELVREKKGLFIWLEENREPTEHILNEIRERKEEFQQAEAGLYFVVSDLQTMKNQTVQKTAAAVEGIHFLLDDFGADMEILARRMYLEPGKLPLIVIIDENMTGRYGVAGYNVGTADMILKILKNRCFCL